MRLAVVDLGTNTCRLLLADARGADLEQHARLTKVVRLGEGVDRAGRLSPGAAERTRACLAEYAARAGGFAPARRLLIATSVLRDAADGPDFLGGVTRDFGWPACVLSGEEEAGLAFRGGTAWLAGAATGPYDGARTGPLAGGVPGPLALVDIGGGSTELAVGEPGAAPGFVRSLDIGVVRLTERFLAHDPPTRGETATLTGHVAAALAAAVPPEARAAVRGLVGVAGTFTTLVAHKLGLREYRSELVHGHTLSVSDIEQAIDVFARLTSEQRAALPGIQRGREDVILAGALIAREACRLFRAGSVRCSEADILEGAALALAEGSLVAG